MFRIGVKRTLRLTITADKFEAEAINKFFKTSGAAWGARPDVVSRAAFGVNQLVEVVLENCWRAAPILVEASFDEFNLDVTISYEGESLAFPAVRPSDEEIRDTDEGKRTLAGFMLRHNADRISAESRGSSARVLFHFDH